jgi:membrane protease YdiL (CAAX protease family)
MSQRWTCFGIAHRTGDYLCFDLCVDLSFLLCLLLGLLLGLVLGWCLRKRLLLQ